MAPLAAIATWQAVVLIVLCCSALIISLYCLFFMVPLKRFMEHIDSLGGGVKGVEEHVDGVASEMRERLDAVEKETQELLDEKSSELRKKIRESTNTLQNRVKSTSSTARQASQRLQELSDSVEALKSRLENQENRTEELDEAMKKVSRRLQQLQNDFDSLEGETHQSVQREVNESFRELESTVLASLDAVQKNILRGVPGHEEGPGGGPEGREEGEKGHRGWNQEDSPKIISAGPLFNVGSEEDSEEPEDAEPEEPEDGENEEQEDTD
jgi:uncharacterized protein YoxC